MFSFLTNLTLFKQEIQQGIEMLMEEYPKDVDLNLTDELLHFHIYVIQSHRPIEKFLYIIQTLYTRKKFRWPSLMGKQYCGYFLA